MDFLHSTNIVPHMIRESNLRLFIAYYRNLVNRLNHSTSRNGGSIKPEIRENIILQSKCGIKPTCFDFSKEYILSAVDGSLKRLKTEYLENANHSRNYESIKAEGSVPGIQN